LSAALAAADVLSVFCSGIVSLLFDFAANIRALCLFSKRRASPSCFKRKTNLDGGMDVAGLVKALKR
jgi:hypothetical protein